jgi:hypothetical protein
MIPKKQISSQVGVLRGAPPLFSIISPLLEGEGAGGEVNKQSHSIWFCPVTPAIIKVIGFLDVRRGDYGD